METMAEQKDVGGRPRRLIPRKPKRVYMTDTTMQEVEHWRRCRKRDNKEVGFSDAVGEMVSHAAVYGVDVRPSYSIVPLSRVMGAMWKLRRRPWIRIEPNTGRTLQCMRCGTVTKVDVKRFSGIIRAINRFIADHSKCPAKKVTP